MLEAGMLDETGVYGSLLHYALTIFFMVGALIAFFYLWRKGRLDMDEEPKIQMMEEDNDVRKT